MSWRPEPPAGHRVRSRFLLLALGAVLLAVATVVWLSGGERRHPPGRRPYARRRGRSFAATVVVFDPERGLAVLRVPGLSVYGRHRATRQVFKPYGGITRGMSGGPLVTTDGAVSAMVFATDLHSEQGSPYSDRPL